MGEIEVTGKILTPNDTCSISFEINKDAMHVCILIKGDFKNKFWELTCPCQVSVVYPLNGLPEVDTLMPCGKDNHWAIKFEGEE